MKRALAVAAAALVAGLSATTYVATRSDALPDGLAGSVVYVSDREGGDALYLRDLATGHERRLTSLGEPAAEPAFSPDGRSVAFRSAGRIGLVDLSNGAVRRLVGGGDWQDSAPAWVPGRRAVVVSARRTADAPRDLHLLRLERDGPGFARTPITDTPGLDEAAPAVSRDGRAVVFVRADALFRVELNGGRTRRLTGGFRRMRYPRFLPSGRVAVLWTEGKTHGIDVLDGEGGNRATLSEGSIFYRTLAPAPDGRFLAVTFTYDLGFRPLDAFRRRKEEVRLLDAAGRPVTTLLASWRNAHHSPDWSSGTPTKEAAR
jgi:Tol biopolymer transport system component